MSQPLGSERTINEPGSAKCARTDLYSANLICIDRAVLHRAMFKITTNVAQTAHVIMWPQKREDILNCKINFDDGIYLVDGNITPSVGFRLMSVMNNEHCRKCPQ